MRLSLCALFVSTSIQAALAQGRDMTGCEAKATLVLQVDMLRENCPAYALTDYGATLALTFSKSLSEVCGEDELTRANRWLAQDIVRGNSQLRALADNNKKANLTSELCRTVAARLNKQSLDDRQPPMVVPLGVPTEP